MKLLDSVVAFGSRTQGTVALSSGEAELYAIGQGTSETLFVKNLLMEAKLVKKINITIHTDSTAGKSMATRFGASKKTKHVELRFLYMQDLVARGIIKLKKVGTKSNCTDPLTKNLSGDILNSHLVRLCVATVHFSLKPRARRARVTKPLGKYYQLKFKLLFWNCTVFHLSKDGSCKVLLTERFSTEAGR